MSHPRKKRGAQRKEERRQKAFELQEARAKRSPKEQLKLLDIRLGKDVGATRERARLLKLIEEGGT